jgi:hypothetical protein
MFGRAGTMSEARLLADVLGFKRDPFRVKHWHKTWGKFDPPPFGLGYSYHQREAINLHYPNYPYYVLDIEPGAYLSLDEQQEEAARRIYELGLFQFLCRPAIREGEVSSSVIPISIANLDRDEGEYQFPNHERVARFRDVLAAKDGIPAATILKELDEALPPERREQAPKPRQTASRSTTMSPPATPQPTPVPAASDAAQATPPRPTQRRHRVS